MRDRADIVTLTGIAAIRVRHPNGDIERRLRFVGRDQYAHRVETFFFPSKLVLVDYAEKAKTIYQRQLAYEALEDL